MMVVEMGGSAGGDTRVGKSAVIAVGKNVIALLSKKENICLIFLKALVNFFPIYVNLFYE